MGVAAMRGSMRSFGRDASVVKQTVRPGTAKRMLRFAVPYAWFLGLFLFVVILDAAVSIANPLIYRDIINNGILKGNGHLIIHLAILVGILGVFDSALGVAQSYLSATRGRSRRPRPCAPSSLSISSKCRSPSSRARRQEPWSVD